LKKNKILILALTFILTMSVVGCAPRKTQLNRTQTRIGMETPNNVTRRDNVVSPNVRTNIPGRNTVVEPNPTTDITRRDVSPNPNLTTDITRRDMGMDGNLVNRARTIAQKVANLNEVDRASCLITGNTAIVAVDMKNNIRGQMTTELKQKIETKVKNTDNRIKNVAITADPDLSTRVRTMATDMENGKPITGFADEIKEILRRITPTK